MTFISMNPINRQQFMLSCNIVRFMVFSLVDRVDVLIYCVILFQKRRSQTPIDKRMKRSHSESDYLEYVSRTYLAQAAFQTL